MTNLSLAKEYFDNLIALITGLRRNFDLPALPLFIGCSVSEESLNNMSKVQEAQLEQVKNAKPGV